MNRLIFAAGFGAAVLWTFVDSSLAATVTFTGVIDEVSGNAAGVVTGDTFTGIFFFQSEPARHVRAFWRARGPVFYRDR